MCIKTNGFPSGKIRLYALTENRVPTVSWKLSAWLLASFRYGKTVRLHWLDNSAIHWMNIHGKFRPVGDNLMLNLLKVPNGNYWKKRVSQQTHGNTWVGSIHPIVSTMKYPISIWLQTLPRELQCLIRMKSSPTGGFHLRKQSRWSGMVVSPMRFQ